MYSKKQTNLLKKMGMLLVGAVLISTVLNPISGSNSNYVNASGITDEASKEKIIVSPNYNEEVQQKFEEINSKYDIGEPFSEEDAAFVKKHAVNVQNTNAKIIVPIDSSLTNSDLITPFLTTTTQYSGARAFNKGTTLVTASVGAYITVHHDDFGFNNYVNINMGTSTTDYVQSITNEVKHIAYGVVGSDGIGIVQNETYSNTCSNSGYCHFSGFEEYFATVAFSHTTVKARIYHPGSGTVDVPTDTH